MRLTSLPFLKLYSSSKILKPSTLTFLYMYICCRLTFCCILNEFSFNLQCYFIWVCKTTLSFNRTFFKFTSFFYLMNHIAVFVVFVAGSIIYCLIFLGANTDFDSWKCLNKMSKRIYLPEISFYVHKLKIKREKNACKSDRINVSKATRMLEIKIIITFL